MYIYIYTLYILYIYTISIYLCLSVCLSVYLYIHPWIFPYLHSSVCPGSTPHRKPQTSVAAIRPGGACWDPHQDPTGSHRLRPDFLRRREKESPSQTNRFSSEVTYYYTNNIFIIFHKHIL